MILVAKLEPPCFVFADDLKDVGANDLEGFARDLAMEWDVPLIV